jgi:hypothetical protein
VQLLIDQHLENVVFQITKLGGVPLILGKTSLRRHNPLIDWVDNTVNFRSAWCQAHCLPHRPDALEPSRPTPEALVRRSRNAKFPRWQLYKHTKFSKSTRIKNSQNASHFQQL